MPSFVSLTPSSIWFMIVNGYNLNDQLVRKEFLRIRDELSDSCKKGVFLGSPSRHCCIVSTASMVLPDQNARGTAEAGSLVTLPPCVIQ